MTPVMMGTTSSITMQSLGTIVQRAPAVGAKMWCFFFVTGRMPRSGKLPVLFLLTGQKSGFSPRRGDSLHRYMSNFTGTTGTWVRLAVQNFTSIGAEGWECGPQNIKNFHILVKSRPAGGTPLADFEIFWVFYTTHYPTLVLQISYDSLHRLRSYCGEIARL